MGISDKLKKARKNAGMTQEDVELKSGINKKTISNWENGVSRPDVDSIALLCKLYKIDPNDLFEWESSRNNTSQGYYLDPEAAAFAQEIYDNPELRILFDATRKVSKEDLQLVADMVKRLKKVDE
ncbi:MAG: helix-turn-helix transcriptional regulator [Eubacteriales bacterium]|nr:helix-turn-helix transcriptional regulator [Eubacteriales bacterium]MDD4390653.1 helix-turn-helix transcriptional regulator [Eubacteriales bacterium]